MKIEMGAVDVRSITVDGKDLVSVTLEGSC